MSKIFLSALLSVLSFASSASSETITLQNSKGRMDAFQHFFSVLKAKNIQSYRLFCIWLGGEYKKYKNKIYIGGSVAEAQKWINIVSDFLAASKDLENFVFEIILDQETYDAHPFTKLLTDFPKNFKITRIEEKLKSHEPLVFLSLLSHFDDGNPAIASDVLRLWEIGNKQYDVNCYRDIDNLIFHFHNIDLTNWKEKFKHDMAVQEGHIYRPCSIIEKPDKTQTSFSASNDHLIGYKVSETAHNMVKDKFIKLNQPLQRLFAYYKKRNRFLVQTDPVEAYNRYVKELTQFIETLIKDDNHYDFVRAVINGTGPGFWINNTDGEIVCAMNCTKDPLISVNSWKPLNIYIGEGKIGELRQYIGNIAEKETKMKNILKLHFMGYDHHFFKNFSHGLAPLLEQEMKKVWNTFSAEEKKTLPTKLGTGIGYIFHLFPES